MAERLEITPLTRIGALLEAYPELEQVLIDRSPAFGKLRNPVLRRTVARIATVENAAAIAGIDPRELVATLRRAADLPVDEPGEAASASETATGAGERPDWADPARVGETIDADALLQSGQVPLGPVVQAARGLEPGQLLRVTSSFRPVPLIEALSRQGFRTFVGQSAPESYETLITRAE